MAKLSVSLQDDLADQLRREAAGNVSAFVADAVRDALDRRQLRRALDELDEELGPVEDSMLADAEVLFDEVEAAIAAQTRDARDGSVKASSVRSVGGRTKIKGVRTGRDPSAGKGKIKPAKNSGKRASSPATTRRPS